MEANNRWIEVEPKIRERIEALNRRRKSSYSEIALYGTLLGGVFALFAIGIACMNFFSIFVPLAFSYAIVAYLYHRTRNAEYKKKVVPALVEAICPGATYCAEGNFSKDVIKASKLYPAGWGEHYKNEDTIRGKVGSTDFVYGEMTLSHTQSTGKGAVQVIDFKGFAFEADFNKHFKGLTVLSSQRMHLSGQVGGIFSSMERIEMEDVDFNRRYRIYTTSGNDQEARYILTPALQHRIMEMEQILKRECGARELSISFIGGRMLIMVQSSDDRFEVKYDLENVKRDFIAFCTLVDIVEQLNLNLRIWTKE